MSNDDNKPLTGLTDKLQDLKDEFGNRIENSNFETWLKGVKEEVGDGIEMMARRARGVFNPNLVTMQLKDIQSIVLRERPTPYFGTVVALKINNADVGKQMLAQVLPDVTGSEDWHKDMQATLSIVMTYEGLQALGLSLIHI